MTDREKAIVMAYTGVTMLEGEKLNEFYHYLAELYGRPVYTHELIALDIEHESKPDFLKLCETEEPERKKGHKINQRSYPAKWLCSECGVKHFDFDDKFCSNCGTNVEEGEPE